MFWKDKIVACQTCKCLVKKEDAQEIKSFLTWDLVSLFYCKEHERPFTKMTSFMFDRTRFYAELEVDADGTPIGYIKKTE